MKDRIWDEENGISVAKKQGTDYRLYYFKFRLSDEDYKENSVRLHEIEYSGMHGKQSLISLKEGECVCLIEKERGKEVGRYEYYYPKNRAESRLECRMAKARFWGRNTWRIAFFCNGAEGDAIGSRHFKVCYKERRFAFPQEKIIVRGKKRQKKSEYFITLPDKADIRDIFVSADDLVRGKYTYDYKRK